MASPRWLIYAMGGGWGHITRAVALARAAGSERTVHIVTNSPYAHEIERVERVKMTATLPSLLDYDCLIVDTFPRGLGGELVDVLPAFSGVKVLVARDLNPRYVDAYNVTDFVRSNYDVVVNPGDPASGVETAHTTAPWVVRSSDGLLTRTRALELLRLNGDKPCIIVCAAGNREELAWYGNVVCRLLASDASIEVRAIAPVCPAGCPRECWISYWPAMELYDAADVVVGGAGYNTVHECLACKVPLIARPWPRKYDRQWLRASLAGERGAVTIVREPDEAAWAASRAVHRADRSIHFENGAEQGVALIANALTPAG